MKNLRNLTEQVSSAYKNSRRNNLRHPDRIGQENLRHLRNLRDKIIPRAIPPDVLKNRNSLVVSNIYIIFAASINKFKLC